jgi:hypothetical protein
MVKWFSHRKKVGAVFTSEVASSVHGEGGRGRGQEETTAAISL